MWSDIVDAGKRRRELGRSQRVHIPGLIQGSSPMNTITMEKERSIEKNQLADSITHLFLPKKTPQEAEPFLEDIEKFILHSVNESVSQAIQQSSFSELGNISKMFDAWELLQPYTSSKMNLEWDEDELEMVDKERGHPKEIDKFVMNFIQATSAQPMTTIPIYIRKQNSMILMESHEESGTLQVETFRAALPSKLVMNSLGSLSMGFPETNEVIQCTELLSSPAFARILYQLAVEQLDISTPLVQKIRQSENITAPDVRDAVEPNLINDWLVTLLSPASRLMDSRTQPQEKPKFVKKLRDQVNLRKEARNLLPFRRSGMWASIKITLQLKLFELFQNDVSKSKLVYKLLMLNFFADICGKLHCKKGEFQIELDLAAQMLAKLGRRVQKLLELAPASSEGNIQTLREQVLAHVESVSSTLHQFMVDCQSEMTVVDNNGGLGKLQSKTIEEKMSYLNHCIPFLSSCQEPTHTSTRERSSTTEELRQSMELKRYTSADEILSEGKNLRHRYGHSHSLKERIWVHDTESFLKNKMKMESTSPGMILDLVHTYVTQAMELYSDKNNPLGISQMVLVVLKAVEFLDRKATMEHPFLKKFRSGIKCDSFDCLMFPHVDDMRHLEVALDYFQGRNEMATTGESILPGSSPNENSFSVRFASHNDGMITMLAEILQKTEENIASRLADIQQARMECGTLSKKIETLQEEANRNRLTPQQFQQFLNKTDELERQRNKTKTKFSLFERPLPTEEYLQKAVVFEALIPNDLASLRDCLAILKFCLLEESTLPVEKNKPAMKWMEYSNLVEYLPRSSKSRKNAAITLGSRCLNVSRTVRNTLDVLYCTDNMLIWDNGLECVYSYSFIPPMRKLRTACTFQIKNTDNHLAYTPLQNYLDWFTHTQNDVIADQNSCHGKLSLAEFLSFGSLRAGHRIQLRNLHRAIEAKELSLEEEPVLALILQTIWQLGPKETGEGSREAHLDFGARGFASATLDMLEKVVKNNETNYSNPIILMIAVVITTRIVEMNEDMHDQCFKLLRSWRAVTQRWTKELEEKILEETNSNNLAQLRKNLLLVSICSAFSYTFSSTSKWDTVMKDEEDANWWFHTVSKLNQQPELHHRHSHYSRDSSTTGLSEFMQVLLNFVKNTALRLNLEKKDFDHPILSSSLRSFMTEEWDNGAQLLGVGRPTHLSSNLIQLRAIDTQKLSITFDIILGTFLVNGYREEHLPTWVTGNHTFQRFFWNNTHQRVQKLSELVTKTVNKFHGKHYMFTYDEDEWSRRVPLVIKEIRNDGSTLTLIEHSNFENILAPTFVENYTHWLNKARDILYLRKIPTQDSDYYLPPEYRLVRMPESNFWRLFDEGNHFHLLSPESEGFKNVADELHCLEMRQHINVTMDRKTNIDVLLPRYNLRFELRDGVLECVQYPGFCMKPLERQDTLIGLEHCTQLVNGNKRILIIPNGKISTWREPRGHYHRVNIDLEELSEPAYFVYKFDEVLHRLLANDSKQAWLYLAALYAVTSSSLPEPFTGLTGTEAAMGILTSGFIWSSSPYDENCLHILNFIKNLAPKRMYYGQQFLRQHMGQGDLEVKNGSRETTEWPTGGIPSMGAYDGYAFIIDKLIEDGQRLQKLHYVNAGGEEDKMRKRQKDREPSSDKLRLRSYLRHISSYNQSVALQPDSFSSSILEQILQEGNDTVAVRSTRGDETHLEGVAQIISIRLSSSCNPLFKINLASFANDNLVQFIFTDYEQPLAGSPSSIKDMFGLDFKTCWFSIYKLAAKKGKSDEERQLLTIILSAMAYKKAPIIQLINLQYISVSADERQLSFPLPPEEFPRQFESNEQPLLDPSGNDFTSAVENIIKAEIKNEIKKIARRTNTSERELSAKIRTAAQAIKAKFWPCTKLPEAALVIDEIESLVPFEYYMSKIRILRDIDLLLSQWDLTGKLRRFAEALQSKLNGIYDSINVFRITPLTEYSYFNNENICANLTIHELNWIHEVKLDALLDISELDKDLWTEAKNYFTTGKVHKIISKMESDEHDLVGDPTCFNSERLWHLTKVNDITKNLMKMTNSSYLGRMLGLTGICPRMNPTSMLKLILHNHQKQTIQPREDENIIGVYIGALAVIWTHIKRLNRCLTYQQNGQAAELQRELENVGHENWNPKDNPEWILLELELDIMIRPIQVDVARQMLEMPNKPNGVMQLNMGEGKTSVIVPMLCVIYGHSDSFWRVTVLVSMFNMNYRILSFAIGGLLNRRLYAFPCKRDMDIDGSCADMIHQSYKECLKMKGVVITQPDYRLSFRLLAYDRIIKEELELGLKLIEIENWLRKYSRDVFDESDELLNVKYQLVYTVGKKIHLDGRELRWTTCQRLLQIVHQVGQELLDKYGGSALELHMEEQDKNPHQFSPIRLLDSAIYPEFISSMADRVLDDEFIRKSEERLLLKNFLIHEEITRKDLEGALKSVKDVPEKLNTFLLISGYLRRGVLTLGLSKRWRVQYGVDVSKEIPKMAIPFRAKDVPAERAEFGHPELAILLTHLSYYYSGLNDDQLEETLGSLKKKPGAEATYGAWISEIPPEQVPGYVTTLRGLNLRDDVQKSTLFELLRRHKLVIDFWLGNMVFAKEAQQFPSKLVMTSWDLCYERGEHPITGFSGTNDSSILLPLTITQQNLDSLSDTNVKVEADLLQPSNQGHSKLEMGTTCLQILERMKRDNLSVLIDAGALMLEWDNEEVATNWLEVDETIEAVLYFSSDNQLLVRSRGIHGQNKTHDVPFELSSYHGSLAKCGVFLDDQHTRGTDLKFPMGSRACVTVGGDMKRDKLLQACMRMRKLGHGHSFTLYLSHEAFSKATRLGGSGEESAVITTKNILDWVCQNTENFNKDGLLYWAIGGKNYAQRLAAEDNFYWPNSCTDFQLDGNVSGLAAKGEILARQCLDDEMSKLMDLYGQHCPLEKLVDVISKWFSDTMKKLVLRNGNRKLSWPVQAHFENICSEVVRRCREHNPERTHLSGLHMEEEQERELELENEIEVEEEPTKEPPPKVLPAKNILHENVKRVVLQGRAIQIIEGIKRLCDMFKETTFRKKVQPDGWGEDVYATEDFVSVVINRIGETDLFLRPIEWVVSTKKDGESGPLLLLSPFEVNELMPFFRREEVACHLHMFALRRSARQNLLLKEARLSFPENVSPLHIPDGSRSLAALLLASGNLYFGNMDEQMGFARFLSLVRKPWTEEVEDALENHFISITGFMSQEFRNRGLADGEMLHGFTEDPTELVRSILICRHLLPSDTAHVVRFLNEKRYVAIGQTENRDAV